MSDGNKEQVRMQRLILYAFPVEPCCATIRSHAHVSAEEEDVLPVGFVAVSIRIMYAFLKGGCGNSSFLLPVDIASREPGTSLPARQCARLRLRR